MKLNLKKSIIFIVILAILAVGFFGLNKKFNFLHLNEEDLPAQNPGSSDSSPYIPGSLNPGTGNGTKTSSSSPPASTSAPTQTLPKSILLSVPFFAQAPFGEWSDPIFQNACEEASVIMAMHWVNKTSVTKEQAKQEISALTEFEDKTYGATSDRSAADTAKMLKDYFGYLSVQEKEGISTKDIKAAVLVGNLVIVPLNGQILKNPYYTAPGPDHHMLVVIGYDGNKNEFITNDVGTRQGAKYRYAESRLQASLQNYPTGNDLPSTPGQTAMIVVMPK